MHEIVRRANDASLDKDSGEILAFVNASEDEITTEQVAEEVAMTKDKARTYLNRLVNSGRIQRASRGRYTRNPSASNVSGVPSVSSNHPDSTHSTHNTAVQSEITVPKVNGPCPICWEPSHWANAANNYIHPGCEPVTTHTTRMETV